jgi:hypothetical protein
MNLETGGYTFGILLEKNYIYFWLKNLVDYKLKNDLISAPACVRFQSEHVLTFKMLYEIDLHAKGQRWKNFKESLKNLAVVLCGLNELIN